MSQIQKQKVQKIAKSLYTQIDNLINLQYEKQNLAQNIKYDIQGLFGILSNFPTISHKQLSNKFSPVATRLLIQNKKYMTVQDLCKYLSISASNSNSNISINININKQKQTSNNNQAKANNTKDKKNNKKQIFVQARLKLQEIIGKQVQIMQQIKQILKSQIQHIDVLFNQIDFFGNGYIDANSLSQFILHYSQQTVQAKINQNINKMKMENNKVNDSKNRINHNQLIEIKCMDVIRYLKGTTTAQKIFLIDFNSILMQPDSQNPQYSIQVGNNNSLSLSRSAGHIARVSELQLLHSRDKKQKLFNNEKSPHKIGLSNNQSQIENLNYTSAHNRMQAIDYGDISTINMHQNNGKKPIDLQQVDIEKINKIICQQSQQLVYEDKICQSHWRNAKYLDKIKLQTNMTNFRTLTNVLKSKSKSKSKQHMQIKDNCKKNDQILVRKAKQKYKSSFLPYSEQMNTKLLNCSQILYSFRYLGQLYEKHRQQLQKMIKQNQAFSMINAFNVIDSFQRGYIQLKQLKQFLLQAQIIVSQEKVQAFYKAVKSRRMVKVEAYYQVQQSQAKQHQVEAIYYSDFVVNVFKLNIMNNLYKSCRKRKPLASQQWPQQQKNNYCRFIRFIISNIYDREVIKRNIRNMFQINAISLQLHQQIPEQHVNSFRDKMQQVFKQNQIHYDKFRQLIGKNAQTLIAQLYSQQIILQPKMLLNFLLSKK